MFEHDLTDPHDVGLNAERLAAIPQYFQQNYIDRGKLPCVATLVSRGSEVALEDYSGTTHIGEGEPIGPHTIFRIYSMTKPVALHSRVRGRPGFRRRQSRGLYDPRT